MSDSLEFDFSQGWSKGIQVIFEGIEGSQKLNPKVCLSVEQVHGDHIHELSAEDLKKPSPLTKADGIYVQGDFYRGSPRPLLIKTADCIPLLFVDRETRALALIHAGWRGLAKGIHTKLFLNSKLDPKFTWAWVGPSLSGEGFEVQEDMWTQFSKEHQRNPEIFAPSSVPHKKIFHAWKLLELDLKNQGVDLVYNVEVNTFLDKGYHSNRRYKAAGEDLNGRLNYTWVKMA